MTEQELKRRLDRVYAALDATFERDASITSRTHIEGARIAVVVDPNEGLTPAELQNLAQTFIYNVAHLLDHTRQWLKSTNRDMDEADTLVRSTRALAILVDLSNADKHGGTVRLSKTYSGLGPQLKGGVRRLMRLSASGPNQTAGLTIGPGGQVQTMGDAAYVVTGLVADHAGQPLGDLHAMLVEGLEAWENFYRARGLAV